MTDSPAPIVTSQIVSLDVALGDDSTQIVRALTGLLADAGRVDDVDVFVEAVLAREALGPTVLPGGIALPHARSVVVTAPSVAVARLPEPAAFRADTDPVRLVLLIAGLGDDPAGYLQVLSKIATACVKYSFVDELLRVRTAEDMADLVGQAIGRR
ncbi:MULTISPECIES: PTS sugar transporter subunit IIA [unclassified Nocardioides]|uniref:PTS sugar transporter subunit IIA n=1 Tax=unclassified Nocardioides TaxID=2615069 RepID=UPI0009F09621|nr:MULTISPECIES: PTS sugar transporter subunit IIA [unclassified Nocardioides]GAW48757.1 PTS system, fructose subfamily, IIC subunit [Nocardioides sp. PD653-B2]GAW54394.1 PTS system, fructose subfamily, IIC subunit [Nocardioides sp. PD653]